MTSELKVRAESSQTVRSLSALSLDCLERVLWYDEDNAALHLLLSGDKPLLSKIQRSRQLSVKWISSSYLDWSACTPLLKQLPQLQSLRLTTWSPHLLCKGLMKGEILPSSLTSLSMNFGGVLALLNTRYQRAASLFGNLSNLDSLTMACEAPQADHEGGEIDITNFPSSLRRLSITSFGTPQNPTNQRYLAYYHYSVFNIRYLPPNLETLVLDVVPAIPSDNDSSGIQDGGAPRELAILIGYGVTGNMGALTNLSMWLTPQHPVDLRFVAENLKRLEAIGGSVQIHLQNALLPKKPIRTVFPKLQSLRAERYKLTDWIQLEDLPPTLTELAASFYMDSDSSETLSRLNTAYQASKDGSMPHAVPMNFRILEDLDAHKRAKTTSFLPPKHYSHFPNVFLSPDQCIGVSAKLPKHVSSVTCDSNLASLKHLPASVIQLIIATAVDSNDLRTINWTAVLHSVQSLYLGQIFPVELVAHFSPHLQRLTISAHDQAVLRELTARANDGHLPGLNRLTLNDTPHGKNHKDACVELSLDTVPRVIKTLYVQQRVQFSKNPALGLQLHPSLTDLTIIPNVEPMELIPQLPPTLRTLHAVFFPAINLANVEEALALMQLKERVPLLKSLSIGLNKQSKELAHHNGWIEPLTPLNRPRVSFSKWLSLPNRLKMFYARSRLPGTPSSHKEMSRAFAYASLPEGLSMLWVAYPREKGYATSYDLKDITRAINDTFIRPTLQFQLPLIGVFLRDPTHETNTHMPYNYWRHEEAAKPFPPQLSLLQSEDVSSASVLSAIYYAKTGTLLGDHSSQDRTPWRSISEMLLHLVNVSSWLVLAFYMPWGWQAHSLLKLYMWSNIVGSAIAFPLSFNKWRKSGPMPPLSFLGNLLARTATGKTLSTLAAFGILSFMSLKGNLALTFATSNTNYGWAARGAGFFVAFVSYLFRNTLVYRLRGV